MSTAKFDTLSNLAGTLTIPVDTVAQGTARAWVNFNGTGTVAIRASFNVSSITDNGTGDYTLNFTNAMVDANYTSIAAASSDGNDNTNQGTIVTATHGSASSCVVRSFSPGAGSVVDIDSLAVAIFR